MSEILINTHTGRIVNILDPQPEDIHIIDIAYHLYSERRFAGAIDYTVLQHSIMVSDVISEKDVKVINTRAELIEKRVIEVKAAGLLHDSPEYVLKDIPTPYKILMPEYKEIHDKMLAVIFDKYNVPLPIPEIVHEIDDKMKHTEAFHMMPGCTWLDKDKVLPLPNPIRPASREQTMDIFFRMFNEYVR